MTNRKFLKILALIAVVAFISVCAVVYFAPMKTTVTVNNGALSTRNKTDSHVESIWLGDKAKIVNESTTTYYDDNGSVADVMNTKTDFHSEINGNNLNTHCKCTAEHNNHVVTQVFQNSTMFANAEITKETIEESAKQCADECIKYGAAQLLGIN